MIETPQAVERKYRIAARVAFVIGACLPVAVLLGAFFVLFLRLDVPVLVVAGTFAVALIAAWDTTRALSTLGSPPPRAEADTPERVKSDRP